MKFVISGHLEIFDVADDEAIILAIFTFDKNDYKLGSWITVSADLLRRRSNKLRRF